MSENLSFGENDPRASETRKRREPEPWGNRKAKILVPLDGSEEAKAAMPVARATARITGASIHVLHVAEHLLPREELLQHLGLPRDEIHGIVLEQATGLPSAAILAWAEENKAMLILLAAKSREPLSRPRERPVLDPVIQKAPCPVLVTRPEVSRRVTEASELRHILLPLDGAPSSAAVTGPALDLAERTGAELDILHVAGPGPQPSEKGTMTVPRYVDQPQYEWPTWVHEFEGRFGMPVGKIQPHAPTRVFLRRGEPAEEILHFAAERGSDLIVLEWRGRLALRFAKVVRGVLGAAPCPVLLLRTALAKGREEEAPARRHAPLGTG
ncbi:MAG: universal stress protein [Chloroflexota bacterium]